MKDGRKRGGRPRTPVDPKEIRRLRSQGKTWREVGRALGISFRSAWRLGRDGIAPEPRSKTVAKPPHGVAIRLKATGLVLRLPLHLGAAEALQRLPAGPHDALLWIEREGGRKW